MDQCHYNLFYLDILSNFYGRYQIECADINYVYIIQKEN